MVQQEQPNPLPNPFLLLDALYCEEEHLEEHAREEDLNGQGDGESENNINNHGTKRLLLHILLLEQDLFWEDEELVSLFAKEEETHLDYYGLLETDASLAAARREAVVWLLRVNAHYGFSALTSVLGLAINYLDSCCGLSFSGCKSGGDPSPTFLRPAIMGELWICEGVGEELGVEKSWMKERRGGECGVSLNRRSICDQSEKASVEEEAMTTKDEKTPAQTEKMSMTEDKLEKGLLSHEQLYEQEFAEDYSRPSQFRKLGLVLLNCAMSIIGNIAPMLIRVYYLHGGSLKWLPSWLQSVGFPVLLLPITILYLRDRKTGINGLASPKLMAFSLAIGLITGALSFTYSLGLQLLPVSTSTLILSSSLAFTALFARLIVGEKFTPYSMAAIILMTLGAAVIAMTKSSDRLTSSSSSKYMLGFFVVVTTAAVNGFILPLSEYAYAKWSKAVTYSVVLQFMVGTSFTSTIVCAIGMFLNKDFEAIPREASEFGLGMTTYYILLALIAVISPMLTLGSFGLAFCSSSVFSGIFGALMVPLTEIASVIVFDEKFTMEKSLSFVLCVCGFTAYFYGAYKEEKKQEQDYVEAPCK